MTAVRIFPIGSVTDVLPSSLDNDLLLCDRVDKFNIFRDVSMNFSSHDASIPVGLLSFVAERGGQFIIIKPESSTVLLDAASSVYPVRAPLFAPVSFISFVFRFGSPSITNVARSCAHFFLQSTCLSPLLPHVRLCAVTATTSHSVELEHLTPAVKLWLANLDSIS